MPRRRIAGKRANEEDVPVSSKKERLECTDLSLACPPQETSQVDVESELRQRLRGKRPTADNQVDRSKRSCVSELPIVPWSASSEEKRNLEVDEETQPEKQCISEPDEQFYRGESVEEWNGVNDDHQDVATEQLVQDVARNGNERGVNVYEKSLIWAARDTERKKLEEKRTGAHSVR